MSKDNKKEIEVSIQHPLEQVFDIEEGHTMYPKTVVQTDLVPYEPYDNKDDEIDEQFQNVHDAAMTAFEDQQEDSETIDPKFKARNAEVAVQFLNTALNASSAKAQLKQSRDKLDVAKAKVGVQAAETGIAMDRNAILREFMNQDKQEAEGEVFDADIAEGDIEDIDD